MPKCKCITFFEAMVIDRHNERHPNPITPNPDSHQDTQTIHPPAIVFLLGISPAYFMNINRGTPCATLITLSECVRPSSDKGKWNRR
jgi:hypothetical protein